ncbi:Metallo peptidase M16 [Heterobasidion irregulare TC 32-1]|uniref:Metallo peptidase M16 n=1 Tax=Heterobasidion irregulare (strain TC 32-1) TaxID=747525 RepID=W4KNK0_HETIT|nr:Metallo peptidase M16 [Heterobasidion irregulare TC 32-1]ETW86965.1 Metallo peptidase M16 [Heterobasidion irregulare TC 32-1]
MSPSLESTASLPSSPESHGNFDLVRRVKLDFTDTIITKWRSRVTGLSVVHISYDAPIVNGYLAVATEIFDDTGCPHTLEHLVFMGSEKYPYKGIIDHFANRGFSSGTNAWTDTDHTAYTVSTAGETGFLQILPIYFDHVLYPTITKAGFVTEVHHINGDGEDAGVVYSEMQGRESSAGDIMALELQRLVNPPDSAYRSETGGLKSALRKLTVEQIRAYHAKYYVPHNLTLIVAGRLPSGTETLLSVIDKQVEPSIIAHGQAKGPSPEGWKRPFLETPSVRRSPLKETIKKTIEFPSSDESNGELMIGFLGPHMDDFLDSQALDVMGSYLSGSTTAPLIKEFVEIDPPLCSYIYFGEDTRATFSDLTIYIGDIATANLDTFDQRIMDSFKRIASEGIEMDRMSRVLNREQRQLLNKLEADGGDAFSGALISEALYGRRDGSQIEEALDELKQLAKLRTWTNEQWTALLKKYYIDAHSVVVRGKPSAKLSEKLAEKEKARLEKRKARLGPDGLAKAAQELRDALAEHEKPIPKEIITAFPVPDVKSIAWIPVESAQEPGIGRTSRVPLPETDLARHVARDGEELPFFVQYDHVKSDFISINAHFSLAKLPNHLRPYLSTYIQSFFSLPVSRHNGEYLTHEEVVDKLEDETVSHEIGLGTSGLFPELIRVSLQVEVAKYEEAVAWVKDLVYGSVFARDRQALQINVAQIQQSLPAMKRSGSTVLSAMTMEVLMTESSSNRAGGVLQQGHFLPILAKQLMDAPEEAIQAFEEIRKYLTDPTGIRMSVAGNVKDIPNPRAPWAKYFADVLPVSQLAPVPMASENLSEIGRNPTKKAIIVELSTIESTFSAHIAKGIQGFAHPDYPAYRITMELLNATESYLWRAIRGSGLAYGAYLGADTEVGTISFMLYRTSNSIKGYEEGAAVVRGLVDGSVELDQTVLDAAKSSIVYGVSKGVSTPGRAANSSFTNQALRGVPQNYNIDLLKKFELVTKEDVLYALRKYILPVFDPATSVVVSVTAPGKTEEITQGLTAIGYEVEMRTVDVGREGEFESDEEESDDEGSSTGSSDEA